MKSKPWFPLYVNDYLADTIALDAQEHGAYLLLLMAYWKAGGPLKDDDKALQKQCRSNASDWSEIRSSLEAFFEVRDGFWHHKRMDKELLEAEKKYQRRAKAGAKGGASHCNKSDLSNATAKLKQNGSNAPHNSQLTSSYEDNSLSLPAEPEATEAKPKKKRNAYPDDFDAWWQAYPTDQNMSKQEAFKAWQKLDSDDRSKALAAVPPFKAWIAKQRDYRVLHAVRFLSQRRFDGYAEQAKPQLVHSRETVVIEVHSEPELFDEAVRWATKYQPHTVRQGQEHIKIPAHVAANLRDSLKEIA